MARSITRTIRATSLLSSIKSVLEVKTTARQPQRLLILFVALLLLLTGCTPTQGAQSAESTVATTVAVTVSVDATTLLTAEKVNAKASDALEQLIATGKSDETGVFFASETLRLQEGATAFDALLATKLPVSSSGYGASTFVTAILSLGNGAAGAASGWMYIVNGEVPDVSADAYLVAAGDVIVWRYTVTGGKDIDY